MGRLAEGDRGGADALLDVAVHHVAPGLGGAGLVEDRRGVGHLHVELHRQQPQGHGVGRRQVAEDPLAGDVDPLGGQAAALAEGRREQAEHHGVGAAVEPVEGAARLRGPDDGLGDAGLLQAVGDQVGDRAEGVVGDLEPGHPEHGAVGAQHGVGHHRALGITGGGRGEGLDVGPSPGEGRGGGVHVGRA